jgi:hypothetical protein
MGRPKPKVNENKRPRGRPFAGGRDPAVGVRLPWRVITALDKWGKERGLGSRSEAIRHLVQIGLAHTAGAEVKGTR